jgi:hypothetical protein
MRAHLFGNWTYNAWLNEINLFFAPTLEDPAWVYPIDIEFYNLTNNRELIKHRIELFVSEPLYVQQ